MNKVFNINLGGYPFTIDEDAYSHLSSYLKTIHKHFRDSEGYEEITSDIEARMAELFQEGLGNHPIVTLKTVEEAIAIMGTPEDFGAEPLGEETPRQSGGGYKKNYKTGRRLFRDPDDEVIAGVCSGIAAYFGIADPLWVRIFFVLFTISGGFGIPAYIILWAAVPQAKNSGDRLAMRGDDINVSNIAKIVEEEVEHLTDKISEMTDSWDTTGKKKSFGEADEFRRAAKEGISFLGKAIRTFIEIFSKIIKPLIFIVGFALIIAFAVIWLLSIISFFIGFPLVQFILPQQPYVGLLGIVNLAVLIGIPILSLIFLASRLVFKTKFNVRWNTGLWVLWGLSVASFFGVGSFIASQFSMGAEAHQQTQTLSLDADVLTISAKNNPYSEAWFQIGDHIKIADEELVSENISIRVEKAEGSDFVLIHESKSRGNNLTEAKSLANAIRYSYEINGNTLNLAPYFTLKKGEKWRNQKVQLILKVPEGKSIKAEKMPWNIRHNINIDRSIARHWSGIKNGEIWTMGKNGLTNPERLKENKDEGQFNFQDFSRLHIEGNLKIYIEKGAHFHTKLTGKPNYLKAVDFKQNEDLLQISMGLGRTSSPVRLYITMPSLKELDVEHTDDVKITGFKEPKMQIKSESENDIKAYVDVENLNITLEGRNELDIRGTGKHLIARLSERAKLDAERFAVNVVDIKARDRSMAKLAVSDTLRQRLDDKSSVKIDGEPVIVKN